MNHDPTRLLRTAFRANALFSAVSAVVLLVGDGLIAALLGAYDSLGLIHLVGVGLAGFAGFLLWLASRDVIDRGLAWGVILADLGWVAASWLAIGAGLTEGQGTWVVAIVADIVALFALVQFFALRRARPALGS